MDTSKIQKLIEMDDRKRELETELKELSVNRKELEAEILDLLAEAGVDNIRVAGRVVYLRKDIYASPLDGDKDRACKYLKENGLDVYVQETFNSLSISAWLRERLRDDDLPESFKDYFKVSETFKLVTKK